MDLGLKNKVALVTGSSSGIGAAIAETLAAEGARVILHGRGRDTHEIESAEAAAELIRQAGGQAAIAMGDLATDEGAAAVSSAAQRAFGPIDILVANAGAYPETPWMDTDAGVWVDLYNNNVGSLVRIVRLIAPGMRERKWGRIIAMASTVGTFPIASLAAYSATKAAFINIAAGLAKEMAGTGVRVNSVSPGLVLTPGVEKLLASAAEREGWGDDHDEIVRRGTEAFSPNPAGRIGMPADVADMVTFLASTRADYVNGANIRVDGGFVPTVN